VHWGRQRVDNGIVLDDLKGVDDGSFEEYTVSDGEPQEDFPKTAYFNAHERYPNNRVLTDRADIVGSYVVVSQRLRDFLVAKNLKNVEFLPVRVQSHEKELLPAQYYIVHPVHPVECIDAEASGAKVDELDDDYFESMDRFVVKAPLSETLPLVFRIEGLSRHIVVHRDLAREIDAQGFTGHKWIEPSELPDLI
jgi:hypothetical protein